MRLLHFADLHIGYRQFQRQTPAGINQREADIASVFRDVVEKAIALQPDIICIAGDIFHNVRPSNPAILHAFQQFARLRQGLPGAIIVMIAGNHDAPRAAETGCILRLFTQLGIEVVDSEPRRLSFPERELSILAVPDEHASRVSYEPDPAFRYNVLTLHGEIAGVLPPAATESERSALQITREELGASRWSYVALGHFHVFRQIEPNACYCGAIEYASSNIWGELLEEKASRIGGKGMVEFDLATGRKTFHSIKPARALIDLPLVKGRGMTAADLDQAIRENVARVAGGIDGKIIRQVVRDVPRHIAREMDYKALRDYKRRALHFHLDTRRPEVVRSSASGAAGKRPSLTDTVRDKLRGRVIPPDVDRDALVELGLRYLREADALETASLAVTMESE